MMGLAGSRRYALFCFVPLRQGLAMQPRLPSDRQGPSRLSLSAGMTGAHYPAALCGHGPVLHGPRHPCWRWRLEQEHMWKPVM